MKTEKNFPIVMIIGAGSFGKWHIYSLNSVNYKNYKVVIIEKDLKILQNFKKEYKKSKNFYFYSKIPSFTLIDILIISTRSISRLPVLQELVKKKIKIKHVIFEKIINHSNLELKKIKRCIDKISPKNCYVNCTRRDYPDYLKLKNKLKNKNFDFVVSGNLWNFSSNLIHFLDLFHFFKPHKKIIFKNVVFSKKYYQKKYLLTYGGNATFHIDNSKNIIKIEDSFDKSLPKFFSIKIILNQNKKIIIDEQNGKIIHTNLKTNKKVAFEILGQSKLTARMVKNLLANKKINLTKFQDTIQDHILVINIFNRFIKKKIKNINRKFYIT